jgi:hypothetical protein
VSGISDFSGTAYKFIVHRRKPFFTPFLNGLHHRKLTIGFSYYWLKGATPLLNTISKCGKVHQYVICVDS